MYFSSDDDRVVLEMVNDTACKMVVKDAISIYNGTWNFTLQFVKDQNRKLKICVRCKLFFYS